MHNLMKFIPYLHVDRIVLWCCLAGFDYYFRLGKWTRYSPG